MAVSYSVDTGHTNGGMTDDIEDLSSVSIEHTKGKHNTRQDSHGTLCSILIVMLGTCSSSCELKFLLSTSCFVYPGVARGVATQLSKYAAQG